MNKITKIIAASATMFLIACGTQGQDQVQVQPTAPDDITVSNATQTHFPTGEVVFAQAATIPTLDPHGVNDSVSNESQNQIFETLTTFDADGNVVPHLAQSFSAVGDTTWEFVLRQNVTFHDGEPFNSYAVYRSLSRVLDPYFASPRRFIVDMIESLEIIDDYTIHMNTYFPFSPLPAHLAHLVGGIISPASIDRELAGGSTISEHPIGTGPFVFQSHEGDEMVMVRNENYWGNMPQFDTLRFVVVPEASTRLNMLFTGEAHATRPSAADVVFIRQDDNLGLIEIPSSRLNYIGFNLQHPPFDDIRVRQAMAMVVDLDDIVEAAIDGLGIPAFGPLSPIVTGAPSDLTTITGTVDDAIALLAEAGFSDGFETVISVGAGRQDEVITAQIFQANLATIGITARINEIEWGSFLDYTAVGNHEIFLLGWTSVTGDADYGLFPLFHTDQFGGPGNRTFYSNPRVDYLLEAARMNPDQEARNYMYAEVSQILAYEVPMIYTFHNTFVFGTNGIEGLFADFNGTPNFAGVVIN